MITNTNTTTNNDSTYKYEHTHIHIYIYMYNGIRRSTGWCSEKGEVLLRGVLTLRFVSHAQPARLWKAGCLQIICSWFGNPPKRCFLGAGLLGAPPLFLEHTYKYLSLSIYIYICAHQYYMCVYIYIYILYLPTRRPLVRRST